MSVAEYMEWAALITVIEPAEREEARKQQGG
jgi:predicted protein tyrosine phosphatase